MMNLRVKLLLFLSMTYPKFMLFTKFGLLEYGNVTKVSSKIDILLLRDSS